MRKYSINKDTEIGTKIICTGTDSGSKSEREILQKVKLGEVYHLHWHLKQPLPFPLSSIDVVFLQEFNGIAFPAHSFSLIGENTLEDIANKIERREEEAIRKAADSIKKDTELFFLSEKLVRSFSEEMPEGFTTKEILESMEKRKNLILDSFGVKATRVVAT